MTGRHAELASLLGQGEPWAPDELRRIAELVESVESSASGDPDAEDYLMVMIIEKEGFE